MAAPSVRSAQHVDRTFVLAKGARFVDFNIWPLTTQLDPTRWLNNFSDDEHKHACHLLNAFMYFSANITDQLFLTAFHNLSSKLRTTGADFLESQKQWSAFCGSLIITIVTGETPNPTDSGYTFSRKARQRLGIHENQIMSPEQALASLRSQRRPVVFVDDFVGSGSQFVNTWKRQYDLNGQQLSFKALNAEAPLQAFYTPAVATHFGINHIKRICPGVVIAPGNDVADEYNALHPDSNVWPEALKESGPQFIRTVSQRIGLPDLDGDVGDWRGFNKLGLCLAFEHSTPDATLPIFYTEENGWHPLVRRT